MRDLRSLRTALASLLIAGCVAYLLPQAQGEESQPGAPEHRFTNRLAKEKSPYLLQHAHNPVDWYPWGPEAFEKARKENKPIFLSVGYSTCHWCHVMERESFEDPMVAKLINDTCVPIKVDREERPDVDRIYMAFVEGTTGSGGWPMNVFLTPDLKPFFGGTYFPPQDKDGIPGLKTILPKVHERWEKDHEKLVALASQVTEAMKKNAEMVTEKDGDLKPELLHAGYLQIKSNFDEANGGFGRAPKFPDAPALHFLLGYAGKDEAPTAREMVLKSLAAMSHGGIHDALGGGFHRYSTDRKWFLPHFEKMLYDQALLAGVYLDAWQATHDPALADTVRDTLDYVLRDLTGPEGNFYSAEDADSAIDPAKPQERGEGAFYVWKADDMERALGPDAPLFNYRYGVEPLGNVASDPRHEFTAGNVLFEAHSITDTAAHFAKPIQEVEMTLAGARRKLLALRTARPRPRRDDKTITAWNGLMISTLARAGAALEEPRYTAAAVRAAVFIREKLQDPGSHALTRRWRDGQADVPGFLDDYAYLTQGLLDLYESTLDVSWLQGALDLQSRQDQLFWDSDAGGYFTTAGSDAALLFRSKEDNDSSGPPAAAISALNLLRLAQMTDAPPLRDKAARVLNLFAFRFRKSPGDAPQLLTAIDFLLVKPRQIVLAGKPESEDMKAMLREIHRRFLPRKVVLCADGAAGQQFLAKHVEFLQSVKPLKGRATAYVCENFACKLPTDDPGALAKLLE